MIGIVILAAAERYQRVSGIAGHGGDVREGAGEGFVADLLRRRVAFKMDAFDDGVGFE